MVKTNNLQIVVVSDNPFAVLLSALLNSLQTNYKGADDIDFYIVNDKISAANIERIRKTVTNKKIHLIWKKLSEAIPAHLNIPLDNTTFPSNTYARICIPYFINPNAQRAIYLDVDMIVCSDITHLWNIDLEGKPIAAVADRSETVGSGWGGIKNYKQLGLNPESRYFNSGMFVLDLNKWRAQKIPEKAFKCAEENYAYISFADQYSLNVIFNENWKELDRSWNCYAQNDDESPNIIHFTGMKPIFTGYSGNQLYKKIFYSYLEQTPFKGYKPKNTMMRYIKKFYDKSIKKLGRVVK